MKKYTIVRDKKIRNYILLYIVSLILTQLVVLFTNMNYSFAVLSLSAIGIGYSILLNFVILSDVQKKYILDDISITVSGVFFKKLYFISNIKKVKYTTDIEFTYNKKLKKIKVINIEENKDAYTEILLKIKKGPNKIQEAQKGVERLIENNSSKYNVGNVPLRLNGWVLVIFLNILTTALYPLLLIIESINSGNVISNLSKTSHPVSLGIIFILGIIAVVFMWKKHKSAIIIAKVFTVANAIVIPIGLLLVKDLYYDIIIRTCFTLLSSIALIFIIFRYLSISKRVKNTFIYDSFTRVEKAPKDIDAGFRINLKESSSLYIILKYLVILLAPVWSVLLIIISLVFKIVF